MTCASRADPGYRRPSVHADPGSATQTALRTMTFKLRWNRWNGSRTVQLGRK
jgi:hypothetical protein